LAPESDDGATDTTGRAEELDHAHDEDVREEHVEAVGFAVMRRHAAVFPESATIRSRTGRWRRRVDPLGQAAAIGKYLQQNHHPY